MTLPASEPRTTFGNSSAIAKRAMINSGAFPKLAFRKPPIPGPVCSEACSVDSPISQASGTSDAAASTNSATSPGWKAKSTTNVIGASARDAQRSFRAAANTPALLEALRARGLKLGLVSNAFDPGWLVHRDLAQMGLAERLDFAVFSSEVGKRKPHPAIFERALDALGVAAAEAVFVGDRLYEDVRGAGELGMTTVQALWFRADEHPEGGEPDFQAFTQMDVLNVVDRLAAAA